jgi:hypothetical protein
MRGSETVAMIIIGKSMLKTLLVFSTVLIASITMSPTSWAKAGVLDAVVSISAENKPLGEVLAGLSEAVDYNITVSGGWAFQPVSVQVKDRSLKFGLERILRALGRPNHVFMVKQAQKEIVIRIFDEAPEAVQLANNEDGMASAGRATVHADDQGDAAKELFPFGTPPREIHSSEKSVPAEELEIIPPDAPGERGVTQAELEEMLEKQQNQGLTASDLEVIPPVAPDGRGITQGEFEKIIGEKDRSQNTDRELVPP